MCGIVGFINFDENKTIDTGLLKRMSDVITHRGPDNEGFYVNKNIGLGIRRLSIIDLATGNQPIHNENKKIWVVLNGEIYNFPELKEELIKKGHSFYTKTDTEVLVHLYEEYGHSLLDKINGMFAFAIWDDTEKKLFLARDRVGKKPLHYAVFNNTFVFASELKSLYLHPDIKREMDTLSLQKYLCLHYVPAPYTIFKGIKKLLPGYAMEYKQGNIKTFKYWDLSFKEKTKQNEREIIEELSNKLEIAVKKRLISDVPLGLFLSGGIDSTLVAGFMAKTTSKINSFSITFENERFNEQKYAKKVSEIFGTKHHEEVLSAKRMLKLIPRIADFLDEPMADPSIIPTYLLSEFTKKSVTVALSGDGGDEFFAGYPTYQAHKLMENIVYQKIIIPMSKLFVSMVRDNVKFRVKYLLKGLNYPSHIRNAIWRSAFIPLELDKLMIDKSIGLNTGALFSEIENYNNICDATDLIERMQYLDVKLYLQDEILVKVDRASMSNSLEVRCPILDKNVIEYASKIPSYLKLNNLTTKYILKKILKDKIPPEILNREKQGFTIPARDWFKDELKGFLSDVFNENRIKKEGLFDYKEITKILNEHFTGRADNRREIWTLLIFELWLEKYM